MINYLSNYETIFTNFPWYNTDVNNEGLNSPNCEPPGDREAITRNS
ncbi:hypothetical protein M0Q39_05475 [Patescibacteria group bacterium]|nr:hypothetical protein [Patescibacteria group bacterium]